jgi:tyrosine-specific transport protein
LWQFTILGSASSEEIANAAAEGTPIFYLISSSSVLLLANTFSLFAIITSLLGVGLSMIDFIADGWKISKKGRSRFLLTVITLLPPYLLSLSYPHIFNTALGYAGGFGEAFLNCFLPAACVYAARYRMGLTHQSMAGGGRPILVLLICIGLAVMCLEGYLAFI